MTTKILFNGSRHAGQRPATLEELYVVLANHPIREFDRKHGCVYFESREREAPTCAATVVHFHGNFEDISHAFSVETDDPDVINRLCELIRENCRHPPPANLGECPCIKSHFGTWEEP